MQGRRLRETTPASTEPGLLLPLILLAAGFLVVIVHASAWSAWMSGDRALIGLRAWEVGSAHGPLLGPYSRYGWSHPGPVLFWVVAAGQRLSSSRGSVTAVALVNLAAVAAGVVLAWRRRWWLGAVLAVACAIALASDAGWTFADVWNPYVLPLPLVACCVGWWAAATDASGPGLFVGVCAGSYVAQSHVGGAAPVLAAAGVAVVIRLVMKRDREISWRWVAASGAALVVLWAPPVWQQLTGTRGNLGLLADYFSAHHSTYGLGSAVRLVAEHTWLPAPWMRTGTAPLSALPPHLQIWHLVGFVVAFAWLVFVTARAWRHDRAVASFGLVAVTMTVASVAAISRITDPLPYEYLTHWDWGVSILFWTALVANTGAGVRRVLAGRRGAWVAYRWAAVRRAAYASTCVVVAVMALLAGIRGVGLTRSDATPSRATHVLTDQLEGHLVRGRTYRFTWDDPFGFAETATGVFSSLIERGYPLRASPAEGGHIGRNDTIADDRALPTVHLFGTVRPDLDVAVPGVVARYDPLTPAELTRYRALYDTVVESQTARGFPPRDNVENLLNAITAVRQGAPKEAVKQLSAFQHRGPRYVITLDPAPDRA